MQDQRDPCEIRSSTRVGRKRTGPCDASSLRSALKDARSPIVWPEEVPRLLTILYHFPVWDGMGRNQCINRSVSMSKFGSDEMGVDF
jgi:hypothetical protein